MKKFALKTIIPLFIIVTIVFGYAMVVDAQIGPPAGSAGQTGGQIGGQTGGGQATVITECPRSINTVADFFNLISCIITTSIVPLLFALALAVFIYGVIKYMMNANDQAKREEGRNFIVWGLIALFVMFSVWGLVKILRNTIGVGTFIPQLQQ